MFSTVLGVRFTKFIRWGHSFRELRDPQGLEDLYETWTQGDMSYKHRVNKCYMSPEMRIISSVILEKNLRCFQSGDVIQSEVLELGR